MPTLREYFAEMEARRKRLQEAHDRGWSDCIEGEQRTVDEFEHVLMNALTKNGTELVEAAGDVNLGALPIGISLAYSCE
ncbi:hypothetical protein IC232_04625 [Microvirga sp. BT688]|uniref:hypothetical protein n=1 Tax=Microvirga sp. TaxID=1873136 RepID=UPI001688C750|nr:hypothetical protein [Microvirga sp.]MBD2745980.1 hypothetical protein [Microvirga sp.]